MAKEPRFTPFLPELDRPNPEGKGTDRCKLNLNTYGNNGRIFGCASVSWVHEDGGESFLIGGDYRKNFPTLRVPRVSQKALDEYHRNHVTSAFDQIVAEVRAFYAKAAVAA